MNHSILITFAALLVAAALAVVAWAGAYMYQPELVQLVHALLTAHPGLVGTWLGLAVIGLDYSCTRARDVLGYRNVGSKAAAHLSLSGGGR